jgi:GntR family transcriptional regulator/MocR family aminotransferase
MGSFSKVLCPSLRLAYLVLPARLARPSAALKFLMDFHTATFEQSVMAEFIADGHFERHIRKARTRNAARRQALLAAVEKHLGDRADIVGANAGVHVVMWLRDIAASRVDALRRRAAEAGVSVYPVAPCYVHAPTQAGLLLGYASLSEADIESGIALFAKVLKRFRVTA